MVLFLACFKYARNRTACPARDYQYFPGKYIQNLDMQYTALKHSSINCAIHSSINILQASSFLICNLCYCDHCLYTPLANSASAIRQDIHSSQNPKCAIPHVLFCKTHAMNSFQNATREYLPLIISVTEKTD